MIQRKIRRINRVAQYSSSSAKGEYGFVFSENISDWMGSKKDRVTERTKRKEERKLKE